VGVAVGDILGAGVGTRVGAPILLRRALHGVTGVSCTGSQLGTDGAGRFAGVDTAVGAAVGVGVGKAVGALLGAGVGTRVGAAVGANVGMAIGEKLGAGVGTRVGGAVGTDAGLAVGALLGAGVGTAIGATVGFIVGMIGPIADRWDLGGGVSRRQRKAWPPAMPLYVIGAGITELVTVPLRVGMVPEAGITNCCGAERVITLLTSAISSSTPKPSFILCSRLSSAVNRLEM
jgi:hypothetical protein